MAGARHDVAMRIAKALGGAPHSVHTAFVEGDRLIIENLLHVVGEANLFGDRLDPFLERGIHRGQRVIVRVPELAGHENLARDDVARVRVGVQHADRRDGERRFREADRVDEFDDPRRAEQRVLAARHRRRARMALETSEANFIPALTLTVGDDADVDRLVLEDRALLDVELEIGVHRTPADGLAPHESDPLQFVAKRLALGVDARVGEFLREDAGEHARRHHRGGEARALLVGPVHDLDRMPGPDVEIIHRAHDLERAENAEHTVEFASGRLGVEVAADEDGRQRRLGAIASREHVAHLVDLDRAPGGLAPLPEQVAALGRDRSASGACIRPWALRRFSPSPSVSQSRAPSTRTFDKSAIERSSSAHFVNAILGLTKWSNGVTLG